MRQQAAFGLREKPHAAMDDQTNAEPEDTQMTMEAVAGHRRHWRGMHGVQMRERRTSSSWRQRGRY